MSSLVLDPAFALSINTIDTRKSTAMDNLTPSDLFSPSKARQQRAQALDWAHIDSWLSYKYSGRSVPSFERNEETLKVLRELSMANERADEERAVLERVEREALKELDEVGASARASLCKEHSAHSGRS